MATKSSTTTIPEAGDLYWVVLDPVLGTEQAGRRPSMVLSDAEFNRRSARTIICPITNNVSPWATKIFLPDGLKTSGAVLVDQVRSVDRAKRGFRFIETAPAEVLEEVRAILAELIGIARA